MFQRRATEKLNFEGENLGADIECTAGVAEGRPVENALQSSKRNTTGSRRAALVRGR